jgi:hypothetical protein
MSNLTNYHSFFHTWRSFDIDTPVKESFINETKQIIDTYIQEYSLNVYTDIVTDRNEIKILHSSAMHEFEAPDQGWKTNTQMLAPLLISVKPVVRNEPLTLMHIGRMYSTIGLRALEEGYNTGFCLSINQMVLRAWASTHKFVKFDNRLYVKPVFLCIGLPLEQTKPHNWSYVHRKEMVSHVRSTTDHIRVIYE